MPYRTNDLRCPNCGREVPVKDLFVNAVEKEEVDAHCGGCGTDFKASQQTVFSSHM